MREIFIGSRRVADDTDTYVIAEIGHNHEGSLDRAEELVRRAADAGADAVKLQKRDNENLFVQAMYDQPYTGPNSFGPTYGRHREALEFGHEQYSYLLKVAQEVGIDFFATAFDTASVDFLMEYDLPAIKIASADLTNVPLLRYAAETQRALVMSTGGGTMEDVRRACDAVLPINPRLVLMQCTAVYPATPDDLNLAVIETFRREFPEVVIGFSGHDQGPEMSWLAHALGARVVEKHYTLDQSRPGSDHHFSLTPIQLQDLVLGLRRTRRAIGTPLKERSAKEEPALLKMSKKLVAARELSAGHVLTPADLAIKSPGDGMPPYRFDEVMGRRLRVGLRPDESLHPEALHPEALET